MPTDTPSADSRPPRERFGVRFSLLARQWRRAIDTRLAQLGLTDATWVPLVHLQIWGEGMTQKELAARAGIDGSGLVRLLDILQRQNLIERRIDESDGRARRIYLTGVGRRRVAEIRQDLTRFEAEFLADLTDTEITDLLARFDRIEARLNPTAAESSTEPATEPATETDR